MICEPAGELPQRDALHRFLAERVFGEILGLPGRVTVFDSYRLDHSDTVMRYTDRATGVSVVGKFYGNKWIDGSQEGHVAMRTALMQQEFDKLRRLRELGFREAPRRVVRPLATARELNDLLVEEWAPGHDLDVSIRHTVENGDGGGLRAHLDEVATFLAELHQRTMAAAAVNPERGPNYLSRVLDHLARWQVICEDRRSLLDGLVADWRSYGVLGTGRRVLIHGDAIPPHFLFDTDEGMICIDVERLQEGDRAADLGCIVAELKHLFLLYGGDRLGGEPYIRHFYAAYFGRLPRGVEDFSVLTSRGRFFMGCYLLRIARNAWLDLAYRQHLIEEAQRCLRL